MRQGHQNRRGRNRNNGGARKGQNPVSRSYESNGPEMKIRGTPAHIAEKYIALSRDAQSNGDPVLAENYLQHAEHYNRIILAYRDAQAQAQTGEQPSFGHHGNNHQRHQGSEDQPDFDNADSDDDDLQDVNRNSSNGQGQPRRQQRGRPDNRPDHRADNRSDNRPRNPRGRKPQRRDEGDGREFAGQQGQAEGGGVPEHEQPEFLRRSVRRPRRAADDSGDAVIEEGAQD